MKDDAHPYIPSNTHACLLCQGSRDDPLHAAERSVWLLTSDVCDWDVFGVFATEEAATEAHQLLPNTRAHGETFHIEEWGLFGHD